MNLSLGIIKIQAAFIMVGEMIGGFGSLMMLFLFAMVFVWLILPFAIFGTKTKLDMLINETKKNNQELTKVREQLSLISFSYSIKKSLQNKGE